MCWPLSGGEGINGSLAFGCMVANNVSVSLIEMQDDVVHVAKAVRPRVIAIGASNLTRWLSLLVRIAVADSASPVEVLAVAGYGRSYGVSSRFFGRELPGIKACGVWDALGASVGRSGLREQSTGIVTDVGNDIFYGVEVATVLGWVEQALIRLRPHVERLVLTGLPASVADIGRVRFEVIRRILVPSCRLEHAEGLRRAEELNAGLLALADKHGAVSFQGHRDWYGWDRIHLKRGYWRPFVERLLGVDSAARERIPALPRLLGSGMRLAAPEFKRSFGRDKSTVQPSVCLPDGTTVALY